MAISPIMENHMEKSREHQMETEVSLGLHRDNYHFYTSRTLVYFWCLKKTSR